MTKSDGPNRRSAILACVAASLLMLFFGLSYRVLAARLAAPASTNPISAAQVGRFPMQIGAWQGEEVPMDEEIVRATDTDAHISRRYARRRGLESVSLWVACGVQARDLMPHRPEVCYTGSGWTLTDREVVELPLSDGTKLPCNVMQFSRGSLNLQKVVVLYYYIVDGQYSRDVSLLRSKVWKGSGAVGYVVQVQVTTGIAGPVTADSAVKMISNFAVDSTAQIVDLFENRGLESVPSEGGTSPSSAQHLIGGQAR